MGKKAPWRIWKVKWRKLCLPAFSQKYFTDYIRNIYGAQIFLGFFSQKIRENEMLLHSVLVDWPLFMQFFQTKFAEFKLRQKWSPIWSVKSIFVKRDMRVYMTDLKREVCKSVLKLDFAVHGIMESFSDFRLYDYIEALLKGTLDWDFFCFDFEICIISLLVMSKS